MITKQAHLVQIYRPPVKRWFLEKFSKRKKPTIDEMGVAPAPSAPSQHETAGHIEPGPAEPDSSEWTEYEPSPGESPHTEPAPSEKDYSTDIPEAEHVVGYVERVLDAIRKKDRARRWLFVKFIVAWLVAYSLVTGEIPWFIVKTWNWANATLVQGGWISSAPLN